MSRESVHDPEQQLDDEITVAFNDRGPDVYEYNDNERSIRRPHDSIFNDLLAVFFSPRGGDQPAIDLDLDALPILRGAKGRRLNRLPREVRRRCRRSVCLRTTARALCALPILILLFFGVLHLLEVIVGRAHLFWNSGVYAQAFFGKHSLLQSSTRQSAALPIPCHSHNDYWRSKPLLDAIHWGCVGVEADIWLFKGELYVGHNTAALAEERTLQSLYIDPLLEVLTRPPSNAQNTSNDVKLFEAAPAQSLTLLIDFKNAPEEAFQVVQSQLQPLRERGLLSYFDGEKVTSNAITIVGTGDIPFDIITGGSHGYRDIFFDAPLDTLWEPPREPITESNPLHDKDKDIDYGTAMSLPFPTVEEQVSADRDLYNESTSYYASTNFFAAVGFVWRGHISPHQMEIIRGQIRGAKRRGLKARYWGTPTWPAALRNHVWHVLVKEGADVLSVDDLEAAALQDWTIPIHDQSIWPI